MNRRAILSKTHLPNRPVLHPRDVLLLPAIAHRLQQVVFN